MEKKSGALAMNKLEILYFLVLIIVHHLILIILRVIFLILGEGDFFAINRSFGGPEIMFSINFSEANTKFCLSLHYNADNSYCLLMEKKSLNLKPIKKILTLQLHFVKEVYLSDLVLQILEKYL